MLNYDMMLHVIVYCITEATEAIAAVAGAAAAATMEGGEDSDCRPCYTANLPTNMMDFRGLDSSIILSLRGGIPRPIGNFPESATQAMLVGIMSVGRLGVYEVPPCFLRS